VKQSANGSNQFLNNAFDQKTKVIEVARKKNKKTNVFIGGNGAGGFGNQTTATKESNAVLDKFCGEFVTKGYGPLMKSLKNEFRREAVRLEEDDKVVYFTIITFFSTWKRRKIELGYHPSGEGERAERGRGLCQQV